MANKERHREKFIPNIIGIALIVALIIFTLASYTFSLMTFSANVVGRYGPGSTPTPNQEPAADAGLNQKAFVNRITFFDGSLSSDSDGEIVTYDWDFGDGASISGITTTHGYSSGGMYNVTLTVTDDDGATNSDIMIVTVEDLPLPPEAGLDERLDANEIGYVVSAVEEADTTVTVNTTAAVTLSILKYPSNPYPGVPVPTNALPTVVDIAVSNSTAVEWPIYVERHYEDGDIIGRNESRLGIYYFQNGTWHRCRETGVLEEINIVWARMYEDEVAGSPTIIGEYPMMAEFEISDLDINPPQVKVGEGVTVSIKITNVGGERGSYTVDLKIGGVIEDSKTISIEGGSSSIVNFYVVKEVAETYSVMIEDIHGNFKVVQLIAPAEFKLSFLTVIPSQPEPGQDVKVSIIVSNEGGESGEYDLELMVDGSFVDSTSVTLDGGESTTVEFNISTEVEGTHIIETGGLTDSFTVMKSEPPPRSPLFLPLALAAVIAVAVIAFFVYKRIL